MPADMPSPSIQSLNPLTGLPVAEPDLLNRRPLAIKISNYPRDIRPQYGLNEADVVFEYYIEWGYTRFIGIFYGGNAAQIGPVRSEDTSTNISRACITLTMSSTTPIHANTRTSWAGTCRVSWWSLAMDRARRSFSTGSAVSSPMCATTKPTSTPRGLQAALPRKGADNSRPDLRSTFFNIDPPAEGAAVDRVLTYYSRCDYNYWEYDPDTAAYLRFQEASPSTDLRHINDCADNPQTYSPLVDSVTREQVSAENVVVIYVSHTFANKGEQDDEIYHIDLMDSGRAYVFRDGLGLPARWVADRH